MDGCRHCVPCALERIEASQQRMETMMATAAQQINELTTKVDGLGAVVGDISADFTALIAAVTAERENLTEAGQAALDAANESLANVRTRLTDLDVQVGDADGSDVPTGGGEEPGGEDPGTEEPGTGGEVVEDSGTSRL
jgi:hypothetical protein